MKSRAALALEVLLLCAALSLGWWVRARVATGWTFLGADSFNYMGGAIELVEKHRYGLRLPMWYPNQPRETPPGYCRMPGYSLFLAALVHAPVKSYDQFYERTKRTQRFLDLLTCVLVFLGARLLAGRLAAWPPLLLCLLSPFLAMFSAAVLTETLATFLTTLALVLLLAAMDGRLRRWHGALLIAAGGVMALGLLTRIDGCLLLPCLLVPPLSRTSAAGRRSLLWALLAFALVYGPWPLRNLLVFGSPHPLAGQCDVAGRPMQRTAFLGWFATWLVAEEQTPATLYCFFREQCVSTVASYPAEAFDTKEEREEVARLFALRAREGLSARVDAGFSSLIWRRFRHHPLHTLVVLPARRAYHLWVSRNDQPLRFTPSLPWPKVAAWLRPWLRTISAMVAAMGLLGLLLLFVQERFRKQRGAAWLGALVLLGRTGFLSLIGFVDARYVLEVLPFMLVLCGVAVARVLHAVRAMAVRDS